MSHIDAVIKMFKDAEEAQWHPWYGIPEVEFRFLNSQADPLIRLRDDKSRGTCSCFEVEDPMFDEWGGRENISFEDYMRENKELVIELTQSALNGKAGNL